MTLRVAKFCFRAGKSSDRNCKFENNNLVKTNKDRPILAAALSPTGTLVSVDVYADIRGGC